MAILGMHSRISARWPASHFTAYACGCTRYGGQFCRPLQPIWAGKTCAVYAGSWYFSCSCICVIECHLEMTGAHYMKRGHLISRGDITWTFVHFLRHPRLAGLRCCNHTSRTAVLPKATHATMVTLGPWLCRASMALPTYMNNMVTEMSDGTLTSKRSPARLGRAFEVF